MEANSLYDSDADWHRKRQAEPEAGEPEADRHPESSLEAPMRAMGLPAGLNPRHTGTAQVEQLQHAYGNQYLQRLLTPLRESAPRDTTAHQTAKTPHVVMGAGSSSTTAEMTWPIAVTILRAPSTGRLHAHDASSDLESADGEGASVEQDQSVDTDELPELAEGETISLPDIDFGEDDALEMTDGVSGTLSYQSEVSQGGIAIPADDFAITTFFKPSVQSPAISRQGGQYQVRATLRNSIRWDARADRGWDNQVNIESDSAAGITNDNYRDVVRDLTPDANNELKLRSPRAGFWSRDLSILHEQFHIDEYQRYASDGAAIAQNWLSTQTASSTKEVKQLVAGAPGRVFNVVKNAMAYPQREFRAYADGADLYRDRAAAIQTKGDNGGYA